ncbi:TPA: hypothetical protein ACS778_002913 [Providencia alcalifaciens]
MGKIVLKLQQIKSLHEFAQEEGSLLTQLKWVLSVMVKKLFMKVWLLIQALKNMGVYNWKIRSKKIDPVSKEGLNVVGFNRTYCF